MKTKWTVEFGYKAMHYFNSMTTFRHATDASAVYVKQVGDVTLDGPYLNFTIFGFGGCPPDCAPKDPFCVYVPELKGGFELAIESLYFQPQVGNIDYGTYDPLPAFVPDITTVPDTFPTGLPLNPSSRSEVKVLKPRYNTGLRVHFGYIFPLTSNDISVNFTKYRESSNKYTTAPATGVIWTITNGNFGTQTPFGQTFFPVLADRADANVKFDWQTHDLEFGKRVKFYNLMTRFFVGVTYAKVKEDINIVYSDGITNFLFPLPTDVPLDFIYQTNDFSGVGPRLGVAGDLSLGCGFSLVGLLATDLLLGNFDSNFTEVSIYGQTASLNPDRRKRFVPALEGKLGVAYSVVLKNCSQVSLEVGYDTNTYFDVKDSMRFTDYTSAFIKQDQDISFDGPYVRLQVNF
jgi:hypothetical protein